MPKRPKKIDLKKGRPELYRAKRTVEEMDAGRGTFLTFDGKGEPGGERYQEGIGKLYALAYTTKFMLKGAGVLDFGIVNLECLWFSDPTGTPMSEWEWRLQVRIPEEVTSAHLREAKKALKERKGADVTGVRRRQWTEGRAVQVLHVGPYNTVDKTYRALGEYAEAHGLKTKLPGHEVYLSDPRRVAPERLKTIVRMPVARGRLTALRTGAVRARAKSVDTRGQSGETGTESAGGELGAVCAVVHSAGAVAARRGRRGVGGGVHLLRRGAVAGDAGSRGARHRRVPGDAGAGGAGRRVGVPRAGAGGGEEGAPGGLTRRR